MKMSGAEFKAWLNSDWGDGYWDEYELTINGVVVEDYDQREINDTDKIVVVGGVVFQSPDDHNGCSAASHFRRWKKQSAVTFLSIQVDRDDRDALLDILAKFGEKRANFKVTGT